jgi:predicted transposase YdaD
VSDHLKGTLDYLLQSRHDLLVMVAKKDDLTKGFTQLAVELIALSQVTEQERKEQGKQEGKQEEGVSIVLRLLKGQFGSLDSAIETRIRGLKLSVIEMLVDQLLDFTDISELKTWLEDH